MDNKNELFSIVPPVPGDDYNFKDWCKEFIPNNKEINKFFPVVPIENALRVFLKADLEKAFEAGQEYEKSISERGLNGEFGYLYILDGEPQDFESWYELNFGEKK